MSSVEKAESPEHRKIVKGLIDYLDKKDFKPYCAAYKDYNQCDPNSNHIADVEGQNAQQLVAIGEAKTCDDLDNERTNAQFKIFSNLTMNSGKSKGQTCPFYIGIPESCVNELQQNLKKLGLDQKTNIQIVYFKV
jgi:hypothetical protein